MSLQILKRFWLRWCRAEEGNMLLLGTAVSAVVLALALVVASATAVQLDYKRLLSMADIAAADAADSYDEDFYFAHAAQGAGALELENSALRAVAVQSVGTQPVEGGLSDVRLISARSADGEVVNVTLQAHSQPPFLPWGLIDSEGFTLTVVSAAQLDADY